MQNNMTAAKTKLCQTDLEQNSGSEIHEIGCLEKVLKFILMFSDL